VNRALRYEPLEKLAVPRPVDRLFYVEDACRGKRVLDLGAMDETAYGAKRGQGTWLHERIAAVAANVVGIDSSATVPGEGLATAGNARIERGDVLRPVELLDRLDFTPEVVVAGELIEHLSDPLAFLRSLASTDRLHGSTLLLTTPNATAAHNVAVGMLGRESTHADHLCILSYKTLNTLCLRAGLAHWELVPYRAAFVEMRARHRGLARMAIGAGERVIQVVEWLFPLLSFGWIVRAPL
jgi:Methyltransferase domain